MKKILFPALVILAAACSKPEAGDKKAQLDSLKEQYTAIGEKIKVLEAEIALTDTTNVEKIIPVAVTEAKAQTFVH